MTIKEGFITPDPNANPFTQGKQEVPIAPISTWPLGIVSSVLVFPTALDQERLEKAFARALSFWPAVCGRFVKSSSPNAPEFSVGSAFMERRLTALDLAHSVAHPFLDPDNH